MSHGPFLPDGVVIMQLLWESIEMGHLNPEMGFAWAEKEGYIETMVNEDGEEFFRVLDAGRQHVATKVIVPEWN